MKKISIFLGLFTLFADQMTKFLAVKYLSDSIATVKELASGCLIKRITVIMYLLCYL